MTIVPASTGASLPATAGLAVVPGVSSANVGAMAAPPLPPGVEGAAAPAPAGDDPVMVATLQMIVGLLTQMLAITGAQAGAANVQAGGALGAPQPTMTMFPATTTSTSTAPSMALIGGANSADFTPPDTSIPSVAPVATTTGGGAAGAPAAGAAPVATTATPQIDMRRMTGSPQSGGVIAVVLSNAKPTAAPARSEGSYIVLADGNGAQLQVHAHGAWAANPTRILEGIQRGFVEVHIHEDGTLHLHDVK